jgi:serine/threonine-protein kinase
MNLFEQLTAALAGRYDVEREIGAGGMATVYLARDLKHNRAVALKVLRPELGAVLGAERFLREIRVTANLQHPNLLPLFDSGDASGKLFYVMPYVEGESLRKRLDRERQLPLDSALHIATAVAGALDYAHRQGVVHRDLKPENILLREGEPMLADFGIALAVSNAGGKRITATGVSLGTPEYMSPEQAMGGAGLVDARTDIYSLGAVVYEMLTGEPPHTGPTPQAVFSRQMADRPRSVRVARPNVPEHVERAIERALEKVPADRFMNGREMADALTGKATVPARPGFEPPAETPRAGRARRTRERAVRLALAVITALWLATMVVAIVLFGRSPEERRYQFPVLTPNTSTPLHLAVSPDGLLLAFMAAAEPGQDDLIWVQSLDDETARPIRGTEGATFLFWSPDNREIGYFSNVRRRIEVVGTEGSAPRTVVNLPESRFLGGTWNTEGVIVYSYGGALYQVQASGGAPTRLSTPAAGHSHRFPTFLPDGRHFLFMVWSVPDPERRGIYAGSLDGDPPRLVLNVASNPVYAPPGHVIFSRDGALFAQELDTRRLTVRGEPVRIAEDSVALNRSIRFGAFAASRNGVLAFRSGEPVDRSLRSLRWFGRTGAILGAAGEPGRYHQINLSPDDRAVAIDRDDPTSGRDVWTLDLTRGVPSRQTFGPGIDADPVWFPDSREVAFGSTRNGLRGFYRKVVGTGTEAAILQSPEDKFLDDISLDGRFLLYHEHNQLMALPMTGSGAPFALGDASFGKDEASFSPDGRWVAYGSNESGAWEIYVASFPAFESRQQVSLGGGVLPRWRRDGRELFYLSPNGAVMSVAVSPGAVPEFSTPTVLFHSPLTQPAHNLDQYDVSSDGQRFLFVVPQLESDVDPIKVLTNLRSTLRR